MRIGMDVRALYWERSGFVRYITNLLNNLAKIDKKNIYILYLNRRQKIESIEDCKNFSIRVIPVPFLIYKYLLLPFYLLKDRIELFHSMTQELPLISPCKTITTFYDLNVEFLPQFYRPRVRMLSLLRLAKYSARIAHRIIAISENTKKDLMRLYKVPTEKIEVIPLAVEEDFQPLNKEVAEKEVSSRYGIKVPFILYVGQIREQKNISRLLDAFKKVKEKKPLPHKLVLAGHTIEGSEFYNLPQEIRRRRLTGEVVHISTYLENKDLALLYNAAKLFVYPSLYEGFGLPPLEAMACGTPVVASHLSSIPEVIGEAGILVDSYNVDELAEAMYYVLTDRQLQKRLIDKGLERAKKFSWKKTAERTLFLYQNMQNV